MTQQKSQTIQRLMRLRVARTAVEALSFAGIAGVVAWSAVITKQATVGPALVAVDRMPPQVENTVAAAPAVLPVVLEDVAPAMNAVETPQDSGIRYFDGRPVRPARTVWMTVTAYSPDHRSCGKWADGRTATNDSVWANGMALVAADTRLLPFGSLVSVPGYSNSEVVPVLDRGGAIKGARLDVLYPTHAIARKWGVQRLAVTVWEYADDEG